MRGPGKFLGRVGEGFCGEEVEKFVVGSLVVRDYGKGGEKAVSKRRDSAGGGSFGGILVGKIGGENGGKRWW